MKLKNKVFEGTLWCFLFGLIFESLDSKSKENFEDTLIRENLIGKQIRITIEEVK